MRGRHLPASAQSTVVRGLRPNAVSTPGENDMRYEEEPYG